MSDWRIFRGNQKSYSEWKLPPAPSWRPFGTEMQPGESRRKRRGETFQAREQEIEMVNAALYLRRPLFITGRPGTGKSSLAYAVAQELQLGEVLYWPITTRTTLQDGLYSYDAIGRLQEAKQQELAYTKDGKQNYDPKEELRKIEKYITLGPLGTALLSSPKPRVLLIDEIDKSDIDLPNDLLTIFEEGRFEIPELVRIKQEVPKVRVRTSYSDEKESLTWQDQEVEITGGKISCQAFPFVILTSNNERDFPAPFLRRCLRLDMKPPGKEDLERIVKAHFKQEFTTEDLPDKVDKLIEKFLEEREEGTIATDQLLNAIYIITRERSPQMDSKDRIIEQLLKKLDREV